MAASGVQVDFLSPSAGPQAVTSSQGPPPQVGSASAGPGPTTGQASLSSPLPCGMLRCPSQIPPKRSMVVSEQPTAGGLGHRPCLSEPPFPRSLLPRVAQIQGPIQEGIKHLATSAQGQTTLMARFGWACDPLRLLWHVCRQERAADARGAWVLLDPRPSRTSLHSGPRSCTLC